MHNKHFHNFSLREKVTSSLSLLQCTMGQELPPVRAPVKAWRPVSTEAHLAMRGQDRGLHVHVLASF